MTVETIKRLLDAFYQAKRVRDMLPPLPEGVTPAYIHFLDIVQTLEARGVRVKISDISDALRLPRPGVTRTVKELESRGYLRKIASQEDGRITYLAVTPEGEALSALYNQRYFQQLAPFLADISPEDAECTIRTIGKFYQVLCERKDSLVQ